MSQPITKRALKTALGITTDAEVAEFFGISPAAVSQWGGDDDALPELRQLQALRRHPEKFLKLLTSSDAPGMARMN